jgi:hypothetical protein
MNRSRLLDKALNATAGPPSTLTEGYSTDDCYRWVCDTCLADFRERFGWLSRDEAV